MADKAQLPWEAFLLNQMQNAPVDKLANGIPAYLAAEPQMAMANAPAETPPPSLPKKSAKKDAPAMEMKPAAPQVPVGLEGYLPNPDEATLFKGYDRNAKEAITQQSANLASLNDYINQMAQKPVGINWTPLAAYIDSNMPGSKMLDAAKAMAPMNQEERDKSIFDLRNQLQKGQADLTKEHLQQLRDQINWQRFGRQMQHWQNMDAANLARAGNFQGRMNLMEGNQAFQATKNIHDDSALKTMRQQATNIDKGMDLLTQPSVSNKMVSEVAQDFSAALSGKMAASDFKLKEILTPSVLGQIAEYKAYLQSNPDQPAPPHVVAFWQKMGARLNEAYDRQLHARAVGKTAGLKEAFQKNPTALSAAQKAADLYKDGNWRTAGLDEGGAPEETVVHDGKTYKKVGDTWKEQ